MLSFSLEKRSLKRPRLGPPDVYPQDPKQKEDELTAVNVKHGFSITLQLSDEFGTARNCAFNTSKITSYFNTVQAKKEELNTLPDTAKRRPQVNTKDSFWPATPRVKQQIEAWFKDLAGSKPLSNLSKKAPNFNKREEIFMLLCEYQVPMVRATWFIKLSSAYAVAVTEAKMKKRQVPDPAQEWTQILTKFMRDQQAKLVEHFNPQPTLGTTAPSNSPVLMDEQKLAHRQWTYCINLSRHMYEEGLLEQQEFLNWVLETMEKAGPPDGGMLRFVLPLALQYLNEFTQSELLARKLNYLSCRRLSQLLAEAAGPASPQTSLMQPTASQMNAAFKEYLNCKHHRNVVLGLATIVQAATLECPTSLVWNNLGEHKCPPALNGSPLDLLLCPPSALPMPSRPDNRLIRNQLKVAENFIRNRSQAAEGRWSCDKWQLSKAGTTMSKVLSALDALDRHSFDRMEANNLDGLYVKVFPNAQPQTSTEQKERLENPVSHDASIVQLLCEWAVSTCRWGEHRAMAVAKLLERRQSDLAQASEPADIPDEKDSAASSNGPAPGLPVFQGLLMHFLDTEAPVLDNSSATNKTMFGNLVHLFYELIRNDVFSHDAYMCTLISRGDLLTGPPAAQSGQQQQQNKSQGIGEDEDSTLFAGIDIKPAQVRGPIGDYDDSKIDDDLDKLLQHIKEEQQNSLDAPDSPKDDAPTPSLSTVGGIGGLDDTVEGREGRRQSRHLIYTTHFPLPPDDTSSHDSNQRHVLLYGVGKMRDDARHVVKKTSKEISRLFSKKFSIDVAEGGRIKKHSRGEFNFEAVTQKMQGLSYFDQHVISMQCATTVLEMLSSFASGSCNYLPVQEHVAFLFDLMELSLNIYGLIDICIQIIKELPDVEAQLQVKGPTLVRSYTTSLSLYVVGVLRRYHCCLLLSPEQVSSVFEGLCKVVKHVSNPGDCSSAERCILAHLFDLYSSCTPLKNKHCEPFSNAYPKIRQAMYVRLTPTPSSYPLNSQFMCDVIANPRRASQNGATNSVAASPAVRLEAHWPRQLAESTANRYSFVCNAVVAACREKDNERLNDLAVLCAELTACCNALGPEWLGVFKALCPHDTSNAAFYPDVQRIIDVTDLSIHTSLAVFTSILIARHCFSLEDFVVNVALPSLLTASQSKEKVDSKVEAGARLTCHLLLRLFKTNETPQPALYSVGTSPHPMAATLQHFNIRLSCDRHLLAAAHNNINIGALLAVLKGILVMGDATARDCKGKKDSVGPVSKSISVCGSGELSISHILGTSDLLSANDDPLLDVGAQRLEKAGLSEYAQHVLQQICSQEWVLVRCLQNPEDLCHAEMLLDNMLTPKQAQRLLRMICYPENPAAASDNQEQPEVITKILENLDQWRLRMSWLDLQLMFKQLPNNTSDLSAWLDTVAKAAIDVFHLCGGPEATDHPSSCSSSSSSSSSNSSHRAKPSKQRHDKPTNNIWLVAPLVSKLPSAVQGQVLKAAGAVLEEINWSAVARSRGRPSGTNHLLSHQPFLSLVLTCLRGQDEQREGLLASLHSQLTMFLMAAKDEQAASRDGQAGGSTGGNESEPGRGMGQGGANADAALMQDALQLRFSLVGGMFDTIQRSTSSTTDWALLLLQLIAHGVIDLHNNSELFTTVLDMLATLIHSTLFTDAQSEKGEENRKHYQNLMKKLKKELGDRHSQSISQARQLLPLGKPMCDMISCEPVGCFTDTKGNKIQGFDSLEKKQGMRVHEKQRISPWDLLEGQKNPAPLSWAWYLGVRVERKPLWYEDTHRLLRFHTHSLQKPASYFLDPPVLPPEDLIDDPPAEKKICPCVLCNKDSKADTPNSTDQSPRGRRMSKATRPRRNKKPQPGHPAMAAQAAAAQAAAQAAQQVGAPQQQQPGMMGIPSLQMGYQGGMYPPQQQAQQQQWYNQQQSQQYFNQPQQQQQQQQMPRPPFERAILNPSKQALSNMLRMRNPQAQFMAQQNPNFQAIQRQQLVRQQMRPQGPGMAQGPLQQGQQPGMFPNQQQQPQNMNQGYPPNMAPQGMAQGAYYGQQQAMGQGQVMGGGGFGPQTAQQPQSYQQPQMTRQQQEQLYMQQQQRPMTGVRPQQPYMQQQAPNVTMNQMGPMGQGQQQMQPQVQAQAGQQAYSRGMQMPSQFQQQQQQQQRMRQQMMSMGPGQQQQTQNPTLMAQLQRQMPQGQMGQQQQHNPYHQPPPY
ncbi:mediator of RNA polymerase II transcription subunit 12 isoform X2 [Neocloeon triangulifer]|uniref:mediator of RNA polymerase II transcription subunit 12 isoform X2 n=1 Tax=Neocloeon triangulifer TaxID=2078957 RepID=UPI00286F3DFB|nr:mediator of RNA polymerase II transcription subunit 12 isoform X2 [Neocloeon triangulifer]